MRIIFMGSAELACRSLEFLLADATLEVVTVITQPDRPRGRNLGMASSPVKILASSAGIPVHSPEKVNDRKSLAHIRALSPDVIAVVAYGQILRPSLLAIPGEGCVNMHASLLPRYRGAAPIQWAIAEGEQVTGVTAMFMNERMDEGDIIFQREVPIGPEDTAGTMHDKLAEEGAIVFLSAITAVRDGSAPRTIQDERLATYAPKLEKSDGRIHWTSPAARIHNKVRGFSPWPGTFCHLRKSDRAVSNLKILKSRVEAGKGHPGEIVAIGDDGPLVGTAEQALRLMEVQPEGKKAMSASAFLCGYPMKAGDMLE